LARKDNRFFVDIYFSKDTFWRIRDFLLR